MSKELLVYMLNNQLANWNVLYTKLHNFHWNVTGLDFFTLHEKFEELYDEAAGYIDEIAERILTIEGKPLATLKEYLEVTSLTEAQEELSGLDMVTALVSDFELMIQDAKETVEVAGNIDDEITADIFISIQASLEKHCWMLKAYSK